MKAYVLGDRIGWHVMPKHYYTANHDVRWLRGHRKLWAKPAEYNHLRWDLDQQLSWLRETVLPSMPEVRGLALFRALTGAAAGPGFGPIESQVLHCYIRSAKPRRVVELGAGVSSLVMLRADELNQADGHPPMSLSCVEPHPWSGIKDVQGLRLIREPAQAVDRALFDSLESGDLLFVDSSHAVKVGSEVPRIYLTSFPTWRRVS